MMGEAEERDALLVQLRSTEGHLGAVIDRMETGAPCKQVLHQLMQSARRRATGLTFVQCELQTSVRIIMEGPGPTFAWPRPAVEALMQAVRWASPPLKETNCNDTTV